MSKEYMSDPAWPSVVAAARDALAAMTAKGKEFE
jgi:hypothetical protein